MHGRSPSGSAETYSQPAHEMFHVKHRSCDAGPRTRPGPNLTQTCPAPNPLPPATIRHPRTPRYPRHPKGPGEWSSPTVRPRARFRLRTLAAPIPRLPPRALCDFRRETGNRDRKSSDHNITASLATSASKPARERPPARASARTACPRARPFEPIQAVSPTTAPSIAITSITTARRLGP